MAAISPRLWDDADVVAVSRLALPEVTAALSAARRSQRLDPTAERRAQRDWAELWSAAHVVELTAAVAAGAARLASDSSSKVLTPSISRASSP